MKDQFYPAEDFEKRYNVTGLSKKYNLPGGITENELFDKVMSGQRHTYTEIYHQLEQENPELNKLSFDRQNHAQVYHVIQGVISRLNLHDIQYFTDMSLAANGTTPNGSNHGSSKPHPIPFDVTVAHVKITNFLNSALPPKERQRFHLQWVPSPETSELIRDELNTAYAGAIEKGRVKRLQFPDMEEYKIKEAGTYLPLPEEKRKPIWMPNKAPDNKVNGGNEKQLISSQHKNIML